jgi:hypothetical protein
MSQGCARKPDPPAALDGIDERLRVGGTLGDSAGSSHTLKVIDLRKSV